jgi:hypothetical protein
MTGREYHPASSLHAFMAMLSLMELTDASLQAEKVERVLARVEPSVIARSFVTTSKA